jgi:type III secretion system FlhB-like substrate exporter
LAGVLTVGLAAAAAVVPAAPAAALTADLDSCLRHAHYYPGGTLIYTDERITASQVSALRAETWAHGRPACVVRDTSMNVAKAAAHWAELPAARKPGTVLVGLPGNADQVRQWYGQLPTRRLMGSHDSGFGTQILWPGGLAGATAADRFLAKIGELAVYGGAWGGTKDYWLKRTSASQCAKAAAAPNGVLVLGDSITSRDFDGIVRYLSTHGVVPCVLAQGSGRVKDLLRRAKELQVPIPPTVIVALGNNDVFNADRIRYDMYQVHLWAGKDTNVIWPTIWRTKPGSLLPAQQRNALVINTIIRDMHSERPNSYAMRWYEQLRAHPSWQYDGIHLTPTGLERRYAMMVASVQYLLR